eukprot:7707807-Pyramimonas_sp.AAC.1
MYIPNSVYPPSSSSIVPPWGAYLPDLSRGVGAGPRKGKVREEGRDRREGEGWSTIEISRM